jgi:hypothetical protein
VRRGNEKTVRMVIFTPQQIIIPETAGHLPPAHPTLREKSETDREAELIDSLCTVSCVDHLFVVTFNLGELSLLLQIAQGSSCQ